jgi:plastocyanin domain-containing protein
MTQRSDTPPASNHPNDPPTTKARAFLRQHRFGLVVGSLLTVVAVASIANARPGAGHSTCCMMHSQDATATATPDQTGKVLVTADARGFHPSSIEITKGQRTTLEFRRTTDETCATSVVFPELKIDKALPLNQTVAIELPADTSSTLTFQCGMGMYHGKIVVR